MRLFVIAVAALFLSVGADAQKHYKSLDDINIRDPYILPVDKEGMYYMYSSSSVSHEGKSYGGVVAYKSSDLRNWEGPVRVFEMHLAN